MKLTRVTLALACLSLSGLVASQEISLACQGTSTRNEGNNKKTEAPLVIKIHLDLTFGKITASSLNCWSGKGDCSLLKLRIGENSITAFGGGDLLGSGYKTSIEIDRRSGFLNLHQSQDMTVPQVPTKQQSAQSEDAALICQGGPRPRF